MRTTLTVFAELATIAALVITIGQMLGWWHIPVS